MRALLVLTIIYLLVGVLVFRSAIAKALTGRFGNEYQIDTATQIVEEGPQVRGVSASLGRGQSTWRAYLVGHERVFSVTPLVPRRTYYAKERWDATSHRVEVFLLPRPFVARELARMEAYHCTIALFTWLLGYGAFTTWRTRQRATATIRSDR